MFTAERLAAGASRRSAAVAVASVATASTASLANVAGVGTTTRLTASTGRVVRRALQMTSRAQAVKAESIVKASTGVSSRSRCAVAATAASTSSRGVATATTATPVSWYQSRGGGAGITVVAAATAAAAAVTVAVVADDEVSAAANLSPQHFKLEFERHASVQRGMLRYMTKDDFLAAIIPSFKGDETLDQTARTNLDILFDLADVDHDSLVSFDEYCMFVSFLSMAESDLRVAFEMFDSDADNAVTLEEFHRVMTAQGHAMTGHPVDFSMNPSFVTRFFGVDGNGRMAWDELLSFTRRVHSELLRVEFMQYAENSKYGPSISITSFGEIILSHVRANDGKVPKYIVEGLGRLPDAFPGHRISFTQFQAFDRVLQRIDDIAYAMRLYTKSGDGDISKRDFKRVVESVTGMRMGQVEINFVFALFDLDGNGVLESSEVVEVLGMRKRDVRFVPVVVKLPKFQDANDPRWDGV